MGLTTFSNERRVDYGLRWYHRGGEQSEEWAQTVYFDEIPQPVNGNLTVMHPDGTRYQIRATEEGLSIMVSGRHGGGTVTHMPYGNVVEITNLHRDYCGHRLNRPMSEIDAYVSPYEIDQALEEFKAAQA